MASFMPRPIYLWEITLVPIEEGGGRAPEPVRTFWRRDKSLAPVGIRTLDHPARSLLTTVGPTRPPVQWLPGHFRG
jgi:hypothetical protein